MKLTVAILATFLTAAATASPLVETRHLQGLGDSRYHKLESEIIGRPFHVFVMLPDAYDDHPDANYPTVYLLDGGALFPLLTGYYGYLRGGEEVPDAIIVGVAYGSDRFEDGNYRSTDYTAPSVERDYWGGAETYQRFLSEELLPMVERSYRSRADRRVIFGQSLGGQFVLYTAQTKPGLFWGHIASNPALHRNLPFFLKQQGTEPSPKLRSRLFVASGSRDDPRFRVPALEWMEYWSAAPQKPWELRTVTLDGHTHMSAPPAAFRAGMAWLFSGQ